jgi:tryptophanyl-tRNA synthetase
MGTFNYPMLMAADILLYNTDIVPVGQDQKQHIEFARDTAEKFNRIFGSTSLATSTPIFKLPKEKIIEDLAVVPGTDGRKMSKSYGNYISLFAEDSEIESKVMSIVTDSNAEYPENVFKIHQLFRSNEELDKIYTENKGKYKILKEILAEDIKKFITPLRERRKEIEANDGLVEKTLEEGGKRAKLIAQAKMEEVRKVIGVR